MNSVINSHKAMAVNSKLFTKEIWTLFRANDKIQNFAIGETEKDIKFPKYIAGDGRTHHCVVSLVPDSALCGLREAPLYEIAYKSSQVSLMAMLICIRYYGKS